MKRLLFSLLLAAVLWAVMFSPWTAPYVSFWWMMAGSALTLFLLAILFRPDEWNVKLGNINIRHGYADIGFLIGEKEYWGGGFGSEAVGLATTFGFNYLSLNKIYGGVYSVNAGSVRVFQKNGYVLEGCERKKCLLDTGERCDVLIYGKLRDELL